MDKKTGLRVCLCFGVCDVAASSLCSSPPRRTCPPTTFAPSCWGPPPSSCGSESSVTSRSSRNTTWVHFTVDWFVSVKRETNLRVLTGSFFAKDPDRDAQSRLAQCHPLLLLCGRHLSGLLLLWVDRPGAVSCQGECCWLSHLITRSQSRLSVAQHLPQTTGTSAFCRFLP